MSYTTVIVDDEMPICEELEYLLESHPDFQGVTEAQLANRMLLREIMLAHGFKPLAEEWWHFTLKDEPYPDTYFDFPVTDVVKGDTK